MSTGSTGHGKRRRERPEFRYGRQGVGKGFHDDVEDQGLAPSTIVVVLFCRFSFILLFFFSSFTTIFGSMSGPSDERGSANPPHRCAPFR